jgi:hypothetical protein
MCARRYRVARCDSGHSRPAAALGATVVGPDVEIDGVSFDSRAVAAGQLFAPIVAERDGHTFLPDALARGAVAYMTAQRPIGGTAIVVDDTLDALMRLAAWGRERWGAGDPMRRVVGHHRLGRQDEHQGSRRRGTGASVPDVGERAQLQQRPGPADDDPQRAGRHGGDDPRDGDARVRRDRRLCDVGRRTSASSPASRARTPSGSATSPGVARAKAS